MGVKEACEVVFLVRQAITVSGHYFSVSDDCRARKTYTFRKRGCTTYLAATSTAPRIGIAPNNQLAGH